MNKSYKAKTDCFIHRKVAGRDILVAIGSSISDFNGYIELNDTAAFIWNSILEAKTAKEVEGLLLTEFEIDVESAKCDVAEFLEMLSERRMVEVYE